LVSSSKLQDVDACKPHVDLRSQAVPDHHACSRGSKDDQQLLAPSFRNARLHQWQTVFTAVHIGWRPPLRPSQAVSYHVTPLAASQLLVSRGNAALGSHLLLLCLVCGVRKFGPLTACRRHRRVAQVHEHRSAATTVELAALFDIEEATSRLRARTVVDKIKARPAPTAHLPSAKLLCHQNAVRRPWIYLILSLVDCCHQCGLVVSPLAPDAIARALEGVVSILTAPATVSMHGFPCTVPTARTGGCSRPWHINCCPCLHPCCSLRSLHR
jgi:hypothetical protein